MHNTRPKVCKQNEQLSNKQNAREKMSIYIHRYELQANLHISMLITKQIYIFYNLRYNAMSAASRFEGIDLALVLR